MSGWFDVKGDNFSDTLGKILAFPLEMIGDMREELRESLLPPEQQFKRMEQRYKELGEKQKKIAERRQKIKSYLAEKKLQIEENVAAHLMDLLQSDGFNDFMVQTKNNVVKVVEKSQEQAAKLKPSLELVNERELKQPAQEKAIKPQEPTL